MFGANIITQTLHFYTFGINLADKLSRNNDNEEQSSYHIS